MTESLTLFAMLVQNMSTIYKENVNMYQSCYQELIERLGFKALTSYLKLKATLRTIVSRLRPLNVYRSRSKVYIQHLQEE